MRNTKISYCYRDASNYKQFNDVVVAGELSESDLVRLWSCLSNETDNGFIPEQVGLEALQLRFEDAPTSDDHPWHALESTDSKPTVKISVRQTLRAFEFAKNKWISW